MQRQIALRTVQHTVVLIRHCHLRVGLFLAVGGRGTVRGRGDEEGGVGWVVGVLGGVGLQAFEGLGGG